MSRKQQFAYDVTRAAFKVPQMLVRDLSRARLTIVRPSNHLAESHLNNLLVKNHIRPNCSGLARIFL